MVFITGNPCLPKELKLMNLKSPKAPEGWVDPLNMTGILNMQNQSRFTLVPGDLTPALSCLGHREKGLALLQLQPPPSISKVSPHCTVSALNPLKY